MSNANNNEPNNHIVQRQIFTDPTPGGVINQRFLATMLQSLEFVDVSEDKNKRAQEILLLCGVKLVSVWKHLESYKSIEHRLIEKAKEDCQDPQRGLLRLENSLDLFLEFDGFLVQTKSCLDHLVKLPSVPLGNSRWPLRTFKNKGEGVISALKGNVPNLQKNMMYGLIHHIKRYQEWLSMTIEARDEINHFLSGRIQLDHFFVTAVMQDGKPTLHIPMWSDDQSISQVLEIFWRNLFFFVEGFAGLTLFSKIKNGYAAFHGPREDVTSPVSPWKITTKEFMEDMVKKPGWRAFGDPQP